MPDRYRECSPYPLGMPSICSGVGVIRPPLRNLRVHEGLYASAKESSKMPLNSKHFAGKEMARWTAPVGSFVKVNSDAGCLGESTIGCGCIIRDPVGELVVWQAMSLPFSGGSDSLAIEALAAKEALLLAAKLKVPKIILETDCLQLVYILSGKVQSPRHLSLLIDELRSLSSRFVAAVFSHVGREGNSEAHHLADIGFLNICSRSRAYLLSANSIANPISVPPLFAYPRLASLSHPNIFQTLRLRSGSVYRASSAVGESRMTPASTVPKPDRTGRAELFRSLEFSLGTSFSSEPIVPSPNPLIVVISGPSGVGKDAVIKRLRETRKNLHFVVTATTRPKRPGEVDGEDYFFLTKDDFLSMIEKNELLEYALVYGDYKGIPKKQIKDYLAIGCDIVLRVDIQGAATLKRILRNSAVFVFLVAESEEALVNRLIGRKTETSEALLMRVAAAREELKHLKEFDYVIVNREGEMENSVKVLESIIDAEKAKVVQRTSLI
ncbi:hypothetical protein M569_08990 [Genlisea aurea]|uniref:guanylate kinase n=1 Tax=Genlisea aurea TaxID=192259 RepID=S8E0D3_9LAMI|nr:hypothetical protein M569_08990 [Genlisea aurea]